MPRPRMAWNFLRLLLGLTVALAVGFILAILGNLGTGIGLHEIAGALLLLLLLPAAVVSYRLRALDRRPFPRVLVALVALVMAASAGALLASGGLPASWGGAPLLPLALVVGAAADGVRVTPSSRTARPSDDGPTPRAPPRSGSPPPQG
jgi:peptidoglycan/LPS O-acetylase OafA/YrhL